ncbi:MAG: DUF4974 domain-containing protein [Tannerella sp.]|jgi:ferric-dicitrate binding protein FerR (iron transport regulator)|nr:DUF4974 domain-containing protein [Tannerella sp.]
MEHIIVKYLDGSASDGEKQILLNWMDKNEANRQAFSEIRDLWITAGNVLSEHSDSTGAFELFKEKAIRYEKTKQRKMHHIRILKYAASVAVLTVCSLGMYLLGSRNSADTGVVTVINNVTVRDDKSSFTLPDGTKVWLNTNSRLSCPDRFDGQRRTVTLDGEGYFEVSHDEANPFWVETDGFAVKVLGTVFDVKNYSDGATSETVLLSGKVEIDFKNGGTPVTLLPGQKMSCNRQTGDYRIDPVDASEYALWKNDRLVMNNEELETVFRKMERWYNLELVYDQTLPLRSRHTITITSEPKEEILRLLSITTPVKYRIEGDKVYIKKK